MIRARQLLAQTRSRCRCLFGFSYKGRARLWKRVWLALLISCNNPLTIVVGLFRSPNTESSVSFAHARLCRHFGNFAKSFGICLTSALARIKLTYYGRGRGHVPPLNITTGASTPIYRQIVEQVRLAVATGILPAGHAMRAQPDLAECLLLNANTSCKPSAYRLLSL